MLEVKNKKKRDYSIMKIELSHYLCLTSSI